MTIICDEGGGGFLKQWTTSISANKIWNDRSSMITNNSFYFPVNSINCTLLIPLSQSYQKLKHLITTDDSSEKGGQWKMRNRALQFKLLW